MILKYLRLGISAVLIFLLGACNSREAGLDTKPSLIIIPTYVIALGEDGRSKFSADGLSTYNSIKNQLEFCVGGYGFGSESSDEMSKTAREGYFGYYFKGDKNPKSVRIVKYSKTESCRDQGFDTSINKTFDRTYVRLSDLQKLTFDADDLTGFFLRSGAMDNLKTYSKK